ncbi:MAG: hypothetical protein ACUVXA_16010 [Candidatus Jordarchaeum sp.]|uniref:hypothetical protein n=1 Tax=Candidatus Jordarchaeum sp. TaxID=2823881 RepID=UPI00404ABFD8
MLRRRRKPEARIPRLLVAGSVNIVSPRNVKISEAVIGTILMVLRVLRRSDLLVSEWV